MELVPQYTYTNMELVPQYTAALLFKCIVNDFETATLKSKVIMLNNMIDFLKTRNVAVAGPDFVRAVNRVWHNSKGNKVSDRIDILRITNMAKFFAMQENRCRV